MNSSRASRVTMAGGGGDVHFADKAEKRKMTGLLEEDIETLGEVP